MPKPRGGAPRCAPPAPPPHRVALIGLGCPKNQVDSELMLGRLHALGLEIVDDPNRADVLIVNTCAFVDRAREEAVETLLAAASWKAQQPGRRLIAAGCLVQRSARELARALPEIDAFVGLDEIEAIGRCALAAPRARRAPRRLPAGPARALFTVADPRLRLGPRHSAFVKIAEGCDQLCAFCAIPSFRGRTRSRPLADLAVELGRLAREGVVEANLIAQDAAGYGRDWGLSDGLADLVHLIDRLEETPAWVRLHYLYPGRISPALLEALSCSRRLVEYIDLPLQHAHPATLRRMNRPGSAARHRAQLRALNQALPGAGVRSAFIVGFPGETDAEFQTLLDFVAEDHFDAVGVFTYSHEQGTAAFAVADDVPSALKDERRAALEEEAAAAAERRNRRRIGRTLEALVEGPAEDQPDLVQARWRGQAPEVDGRVLIEDAACLAPGERVRVTISDATATELRARVASAPSP